MAVDVIFETAKDPYTIYQLVPNPDTEPGTGYKYGAVLKCKDRNDEKWNNEIFIGPDALADLGEIFARAADGYNK